MTQNLLVNLDIQDLFSSAFMEGIEEHEEET
jgi:hypothetical protein